MNKPVLKQNYSIEYLTINNNVMEKKIALTN